MHYPRRWPTKADDLCTVAHHIEGCRRQVWAAAQRVRGALQHGATSRRPVCGVSLRPLCAPLASALCAGPSHRPGQFYLKHLLYLLFYTSISIKQHRGLCWYVLIFSIVVVCLKNSNFITPIAQPPCYMVGRMSPSCSMRERSETGTPGHVQPHSIAEALAHGLHLALLIPKLDFPLCFCASPSLWLQPACRTVHSKGTHGITELSYVPKFFLIFIFNILSFQII